MFIKNVGRCLMSLCFGGMLLVAPATLLAAGNNGPGVGDHNFNSPVVPAVSEQTPGFHSLKTVDDDDYDGGGFGYGFGFGDPGWGDGWYGGPYWGRPSYYYSVPLPRLAIPVCAKSRPHAIAVYQETERAPFESTQSNRRVERPRLR
jgi:hypothetical protein